MARAEPLAVPDLEPVRLLDPAGRLHERAVGPIEIDDDLLREFHRRMRLTRLLDSEFINLQRQGQLAVYPSSAGQEAAQVGTAAALRTDDWIVSSYRDHGCLYVRGIDPVELGHFWRGTWTGMRGSALRRVTPHSVPVASNGLHAVGIAMGCRLAGEETVAAAYFGDGGTSEGDAHEALNFAGVFEAPVVFVVQNNGWAISVPIERQTRAPSLAHKAVGYGMPGVRVDGNDVLACYAVMTEAVARARAGAGPTFIEAVTYRMGAHTTADDPSRYRSETDVDAWREADPIARLERLLRNTGRWDQAHDAETEQLGAEAAAQLRRGLYDAPFGDPTELFDHVFVDPPMSISRQRADLAAELAGRAEDEG